MHERLSLRDRELYRRCDEILYYRWDPIGVSDALETRSEYESYVPAVFAKVRGGASADDIAEHLDRIATERIGLPSDLEHARWIAKTLLRLREVIDAPPERR